MVVVGDQYYYKTGTPPNMTDNQVVWRRTYIIGYFQYMFVFDSIGCSLLTLSTEWGIMSPRINRLKT